MKYIMTLCTHSNNIHVLFCSFYTDTFVEEVPSHYIIGDVPALYQVERFLLTFNQRDRLPIGPWCRSLALQRTPINLSGKCEFYSVPQIPMGVDDRVKLSKGTVWNQFVAYAELEILAQSLPPSQCIDSKKISTIATLVLGPFEKNNFPSPNQAY